MTAWAARVLRSFRHAFNGISWALRTQCNLQIHLAASAVVFTLGLIQNLPPWKWCCIGFCVALVWVAELFNTALEIVCDRLTLERDEHIRRAKDVAAGAVLVAAALAVFTAVMILV